MEQTNKDLKTDVKEKWFDIVDDNGNKVGGCTFLDKSTKIAFWQTAKKILEEARLKQE